MARKMPILRVAGPTLLVSSILFGACTASAIFLYRFHASSAEVLTEDIDSRKVAEQLERELTTLRNRLRSNNRDVDDLHALIQALLMEAHELANSDGEMILLGTLEEHFEHYLELWSRRGAIEGKEMNDSVRQAMAQLDEALDSTARLYNFSKKEIDQSEAALKATVKWLAWGMVAVGSIGSLAGIILGYGVARALRQSIYKLSVRIRDAADRLRQDLPTVVISEAEGIDYLHEQMQLLVRQIDEVVARLHQREREVRRAEQMAAVGQLAAGVAHELRNPLTAVKMLVQSAREDLETNGIANEDLQIIEKEIRRLEGSLQAFLDFARPPKMERRRVDLASILEEALALVSGRARKQGVECRFAPPEPAIVLEADPEQLRQLVLNLAMNALDAMPQGGTLTFAVSIADEQVEVSVLDTGTGIAPEVMPRLFEPFVSGKETGLGLGLVVSRRIAEDHDGSLHGANRPEGGACFVLRLPITIEFPSRARSAAE